METANVEFDDSLAREASLEPGRTDLLEMTCVRLTQEEAPLGWTNLRRIAFFYRHNSHSA